MPPQGVWALTDDFSADCNVSRLDLTVAPATEASAKAPSLQCHAPGAVFPRFWYSCRMKASSWLVVCVAGSVLSTRAIAGLPVSGSAGDTDAGAASVVKTNEAPAEAAAQLAQALEALSARDRAVQDAAVQTLVAMKDAPGWHVGLLGVIRRTDRQDVARRAIDALVTGELARADAKPVELPNPGGQPTVWRGVDSLIDRTGLEGISEQAAAMLDAALLRSPQVPLAAMQKRSGELHRAGLWSRYIRLARAAGVDVVPMILADIQSSDPRVRAPAMQLLGTVERPESWALSLARARSDDPSVRLGSLGSTFSLSRERFTSYAVLPPTEAERRRWAAPYARWIDGLDSLLRTGPDDVALAAGVQLRMHGALTDDRLASLLRRAWAIAEQPTDRRFAVDVGVPNQMPTWLLAEIILMALEPDVEKVHQRLLPSVVVNAWWMPHVLRVSDPPRWPDELLAAVINLPVGPESSMSVTSMIPSAGARGVERLQTMLRSADADTRQRAAWILIAAPQLTKQSAEELVLAAKSLSGSDVELVIIRTLLERAPQTPGLRELCAQLVLRATDATAERDGIEAALAPLNFMDPTRLPQWANGAESVLAPIFSNPKHALHDRYRDLSARFALSPTVPGTADRQAVITKAIDELGSTPHRDRVWSSPSPEEWQREFAEQMATEFLARQSALGVLHSVTYDRPEPRAIEAMLRVLCDERFIGPPPPVVRSVYEYISAADDKANAEGGAKPNGQATPDAATKAEAARRREFAEAEHGRDEARRNAWYREQTLVHRAIELFSYQVSKHPGVAEQLAADPSWRTNPQIALRVAVASVPRNGVATDRWHARVANENWTISPALLAAARPAILEAIDTNSRVSTVVDTSRNNFMIRSQLFALLSRLARLSTEPDAELIAKLHNEMRFGIGPFGPLNAMRAMAGFRGEARRRPQPAAGTGNAAPAAVAPTAPAPFNPQDFDITYAVNAVDPNDPVLADVLAELIVASAPDGLHWWAEVIADTAPAGKPPRAQLASLIAARAQPGASSWTLEHILRALTTADPTHPAITDINARLEAMYAEVPKQR